MKITGNFINLYNIGTSEFPVALHNCYRGVDVNQTRASKGSRPVWAAGAGRLRFQNVSQNSMANSIISKIIRFLLIFNKNFAISVIFENLQNFFTKIWAKVEKLRVWIYWCPEAEFHQAGEFIKKFRRNINEN